MHVVIAGFGRVGRRLAHDLEEQNHTVSIIDRNPAVFAEYGVEIVGNKLTGAAFDRETLIKAGIERADAFAAVTSGDNSNIVSARVALERFHVPNVIARIFDPDRAVLYERFGIPTFSSVRWAGAHLLARLLQTEFNPDASYGNGEVITVDFPAPKSMMGKRVADIETPGQLSVTSVVRDGIATIPQSHTEIVKGDTLVVTATRESLDALSGLLETE